VAEPRTFDDGQSVPFDPDSTDPGHIVAKALAEYEGWGEIRPHHRYRTNAVLRALKAKGLLVDRRRKAGSR
jgi:hypothetical protein